jgi:hypothetical protein
MAVLNTGQTWHIRYLEFYIALILKNEELSSPLKVIESKNIEKAIEHARDAIDQPGLLDSSDKSIVNEFLSELQAARSACSKKDENGKYLGEMISSSNNGRNELAVLEARIKGTFFPAIQRISLEKKLGSGKAVDKKKPKKKLPLSEKAAAVYELLKALPEYKGLTGEKILEKLEKQNPPIIFDHSTLTKNIIPELHPYGVKNKRGAGYYIGK